jgi:putative heme-binding domain-containing protein
VLFGEGRKVGPELTGAQRNNLDYVLLNLVDPNSAVGRDFRITIIVTDAGRSVAGIIVAENEGSVTIRTANDDVTIPLDEIDIRKRSAVSMMPEGMLDKLTPEQIRDLVVYLASPTQVPLPKQPTQK